MIVLRGWSSFTARAALRHRPDTPARSHPMGRRGGLPLAVACVALFAPAARADTLGGAAAASGTPPPPVVRTATGGAAAIAPLPARVVAAGIAGAGAVAPVGAFHPGGPIRDKPEFAAFTGPGRVLDPHRVLVAGSSNFGAPRARGDEAEGAVLSIDPRGAAAALVVPARFAADGGPGGQPAALDGRVQLFAAQSAPFLNAVNTPGAATAALPSVSAPLGMSINNAFGRLWFANAPRGAAGPGTLSIADPGGQPLAGAPSRQAGGVFAGDLTARAPRQAVEGGLRTGAVATAFLGPSPDGGRRAVFAALTADGALAQAHTERDVDGLAPAGTVSPLAPPTAAAPDPARPARAGLVFNWVPDRILYATDAGRGAIVALDLADDGEVFRIAGHRSIALPELNGPVDLAPAVPEVASPAFSSNTTLAGGSDLYVANRGDGTVVRMRQDGRVVAVRRVEVDGAPLGPGSLNGIAVSPDAQRIWLTVDGALATHHDAPGALLEAPAFGATAPPAGQRSGGRSDGHRPSSFSDLAARGERLFAAEFGPEQGLGPLFNARSCAQCHRSPALGGVGERGLAVVHRIGRTDAATSDGYDPLPGAGGPVARARSAAEFGAACAPPAGIPASANLVSVRNATPLFGLGLLAAVPDSAIRAAADAQPPAVRGRPNPVAEAADGGARVGRFGWKADAASLERFVAEAFRNELGITSPLAPHDPGAALAAAAGCDAIGAAPEDDGATVRAVSAFLAALPPLEPAPVPARLAAEAAAGAAVFARIGCAACHVPVLSTAGGAPVPLYSDLLLHDMGPALDDRVPQGAASGREWRTALLWGLSARPRLLHNGRAEGPAAAVLAHDGQGAAAADAFRRLIEAERAALLAFLATL